MNNRENVIDVVRCPYGRKLDVYIGQYDKFSNLEYGADPLTTHPLVETSVMQPVMQINPDRAVQLMDSLWRAGIRPTDKGEDAGQVAAMKEHIANLNQIINGLVERLK